MVVGHGVAPCVSCVSCRRVHWLTRRRIETDGFAPPMPRGGAFTARCITTVRPAARRAPAGLTPRSCSGLRHLRAARAPSATSRKMDLPRGRAPRCPRYQRGASLSTLWQNKVVPAARRRRSLVIGLPADPLAVPVPPGRLREWGFLSESHRPRAAYDTAASTARPRNRKEVDRPGCAPGSPD